MAPRTARADPAVDDLPTRVVRRPREQRRRRRRRLLALQIGSSVLFIALIVGLSWVGYRSSLKITGGKNLSVTDPSAPNYVAEVKPTPVDLFAVTGRDDKLATAMIVTAGAGGKGGAVIPISARVVPDNSAEAKSKNLQNLMSDGGIDNLRTKFGSALTFGFSDATTVPAATIDALAAKAGPITVELSDNVLQPGVNGAPATVKYPAGKVVLQPKEVLDFLAFVGDGETETNQGLRDQTALEALFAALKGKDLTGIDGAGSSDSGFVGLLPSLLDGQVTFDQLPIAEVPIPVPGSPYTVYSTDTKALPSFVSRNVPFPVAATPGQRARVRLLNGTKKKDAAEAVASKIVTAGGELSLIGNADSFDEQKSRVEYAAPEAKAAADAIAAALGVQATKAGSDLSSVDVNVVIGADLAS